jgi:hypothetical protein
MSGNFHRRDKVEILDIRTETGYVLVDVDCIPLVWEHWPLFAFRKYQERIPPTLQQLRKTVRDFQYWKIYVTMETYE